MRIRLPFNKIFIIGLLDMNRVVIGLNSTSFCEEGKQILMLDYDKQTLEEVRKDCKRLQKKYGLPSFYIFNSSRGDVDRYHAYCMTCLSFNAVMMMVFDSKSDRRHQECLLANKKATLRITKKKGKDSKIKFVEEVLAEGDLCKEIKGAKQLLSNVIENA